MGRTGAAAADSTVVRFPWCRSVQEGDKGKTQKIGLLFLKEANIHPQLCWKKLILVAHCDREGRKGERAFQVKTSPSSYVTCELRKHDFMEQGEAEIPECLHLVGHMLSLLSWIKIAIHRNILSVTSESWFVILLRVRHVICKRDFLPHNADKKIIIIMQEQGDNQRFW